jgi:hypothetical protein
MTEQRADEHAPGGGAETAEAGTRRDEPEAELQAEQESAAAMDADVPQPPDESQADEGQPASG